MEKACPLQKTAQFLRLGQAQAVGTHPEAVQGVLGEARPQRQSQRGEIGAVVVVQQQSPRSTRTFSR